MSDGSLKCVWWLRQMCLMAEKTTIFKITSPSFADEGISSYLFISLLNCKFFLLSEWSCWWVTFIQVMNERGSNAPSLGILTWPDLSHRERPENFLIWKHRSITKPERPHIRKHRCRGKTSPLKTSWTLVKIPNGSTNEINPVTSIIVDCEPTKLLYYVRQV